MSNRLKCFKALAFCSLIAGSLHATSKWSGSESIHWDSHRNWNGGIPNGHNAHATISSRRQTHTTIDSHSDITLGTLHLDNPGTTHVHFTDHSLIFQTHNDTAQIKALNGHNIIDTPLIINDKFLRIYGHPSSTLSLEGDVSGPGGLIFHNGKFSMSGNNSHGGETVLVHSFMTVKSSGTAFPGAVSVSDSSRLVHESSNHYSPNSALYVVNNGAVDFGSTNQTFFDLRVYKGTVVGPNATVTLLSPDLVILVRDVSRIGIQNLILQNGGTLQFSSIDGLFDGRLVANSIMSIDLSGNNLNIDAHHPEAFSDFSMGFNDVALTDGSITTVGPGKIFFSGQQGSLPSLFLNSGTVFIGQSSTDIVDAAGAVEIGSNGTLGGFGTLGIQGDAIVNNDGTLEPGTSSQIGALTLSGAYTQDSSGTLIIKGQNGSACDKLVVTGDVSLDGTLVFRAQNPKAFKSGDQIVLLDNTQSSAPITGAFSSFETNVTGALQYNGNRVLLVIN